MIRETRAQGAKQTFPTITNASNKSTFNKNQDIIEVPEGSRTNLLTYMYKHKLSYVR